MFRFCRVIEDKGRQYLVRAANNTYLVGMGEPAGPACALTVDTWVTEPGRDDWDTMRMVLRVPSYVELLQMLECFGVQHAREAGRLLLASHAHQLTREEQLAGQQAIGESVGLVIRQRYGRIG